MAYILYKENDIIGTRKLLKKTGEKGKEGRALWLTECVVCGLKVARKIATLKVADCICQKREELTGQIFGSQKIVQWLGKHPSQRGKLTNMWLCECLKCGHQRPLTTESAKHGKDCIKCRKTNRKLPEGASLRNQIKLNYISRAKERGFSWNLSDEVFKELLGSNCYYCGKTPSQKNQRSKGRKYFILYNGIDRIDSNIGYEVKNCVSCCKMCNRAKRDYSVEDFLNWVSSVQNYQDYLKYGDRLIGACA